jgi:hypothetical protein
MAKVAIDPIATFVRDFGAVQFSAPVSLFAVFCFDRLNLTVKISAVLHVPLVSQLPLDRRGGRGSAEMRRSDGATRVMTARPCYPFVWLGVPLGIILLFTIGPLAALLLGGAVADALGCSMPISGSEPCLFMGIDFADALIIAVLFGYLAFWTLPTGTTLLGIWFVAAVIVTLVWWLRRRRAA